MSIIFCDTETYSTVPISNGTYAYAEKAEILIFTYAFDDGEVQVWDATECHTMPKDLYYGLTNPKNTMVWHNSMFDRTILKHARGMDLSTDRIFDTMVCAMCHGLPGGLAKLGMIFGLEDDEAKDKAGKKLIQLFCKPLGKNRKLDRATRETHPEEWASFINYAKQDITAMRKIYQKLPKWNYKGDEFQLWRLDQKINDRGFKADLKLANAAIRNINRIQKDLAQQTSDLTDGEVQSTTQRNKLLAHICNEYGVNLPDLTKSTLERRIDDPELPQGVKELLAIRQEASTTSTSKYKKVLSSVSSDGRLRGTLQFCGAQRTGRWAGRTFQPQNLPRPPKHHKNDVIESGIESIKADCVDLVVEDPMRLISSALRGCIIADDGKKLVVSDLSNIEGRAAAYLTNERWKLDAFLDYDNGVGEDLYKITYGRAFDVDPKDVDSYQRQLGKVQELALGYEGGVGAFVTFVMTYRMDLDELAENAIKVIPEKILKEAESAWGWATRQKRTLGLEKDVYVACDSLKRMWRYAHPQITNYWRELGDAVRKAIQNDGQLVKCKKLIIKKSGAWLRIQLPSGRSLCYPSPAVNENNEISYMGMNQYTRQWSRIKTYGGKLFENVCQAFARDIMADAMPEVEEKGYNILLTVHDELITEAPDREEFGHEHLSLLLATPPEWADDMPLAAGGFEGYRYKKD